MVSRACRASRSPRLMSCRTRRSSAIGRPVSTSNCSMSDRIPRQPGTQRLALRPPRPRARPAPPRPRCHPTLQERRPLQCRPPQARPSAVRSSAASRPDAAFSSPISGSIRLRRSPRRCISPTIACNCDLIGLAGLPPRRAQRAVGRKDGVQPGQGLRPQAFLQRRIGRLLGHGRGRRSRRVPHRARPGRAAQAARPATRRARRRSRRRSPGTRTAPPASPPPPPPAAAPARSPARA